MAPLPTALRRGRSTSDSDRRVSVTVIGGTRLAKAGELRLRPSACPHPATGSWKPVATSCMHDRRIEGGGKTVWRPDDIAILDYVEKWVISE